MFRYNLKVFIGVIQMNLNYKVEKDRDDDDLSHVQIEGSCQGCHGGWVG